jgi:hypothetical protein
MYLEDMHPSEATSYLVEKTRRRTTVGHPAFPGPSLCLKPPVSEIKASGWGSWGAILSGSSCFPIRINLLQYYFFGSHCYGKKDSVFIVEGDG